jgi:hypothetical protein
MPQCASVKNKKSDLQCSAKSIGELNVCGRHAKSKAVILWATVNARKISKFSKVQACVRGWLVRSRLRQGGPGVLRRADLSNDEDIVTCEEKERQHPFDYFAFTENGKTWWFHFDSLWSWTTRSLTPSNPYTKVPLTAETRTRLRAMWAYRRRHRISLVEEPTRFEERLTNRWNVICQTLADNGFDGSIEPRIFLRLTKLNFITAFRFLQGDFRVAMRETDPARSIQLARCDRMIRIAYSTEARVYALQSSYMFMLLITEQKESYTTLFMLLSALYRC